MQDMNKGLSSARAEHLHRPLKHEDSIAPVEPLSSTEVAKDVLQLT